MKEYILPLLMVLFTFAIIRVLWTPISKLAKGNDKYEAERRRIQLRKKELGIDDEPDVNPPLEKSSPMVVGLQMFFGFIFGGFIIVALLRCL